MQKLSKEVIHTLPKDINAFYAVLKYHHFEASQTPESFSQAFNALSQAIIKEPESGIANAMFASLHFTHYMLDFPGAENVYVQIGTLAEKALKLNPNNLTVNIIYALKHFAYNEKALFFKEIEKCLSMNPSSPIRLGAIGQYLALYGEWERGKKILDNVMHMNISFPLYYFGTTALYFYRKQEYLDALTEANQYDVPDLFWGPLLRAAIFGQLGKPTEAKPNIAHLKQLKPDFEQKAQFLISRFVKEEELVEHVMEGLRKAGLEL